MRRWNHCVRRRRSKEGRPRTRRSSRLLPGGIKKSKLPTSNLYVVETDFAVSPDTYNNLQAMLDVVREKYGLDFLILEPGFKLKRFDDY